MLRSKIFYLFNRAGNLLIRSSLIRSFAHSLIRSFCPNQMGDCERFAQIAQDKWANEQFAQKIWIKKSKIFFYYVLFRVKKENLKN